MAISRSQPIGALNLTTGLNMLLGVWMFWSPWEFGAASNSSAWNNWIVGAIVALAALIRVMHPHGSRRLSILNLALAVWIIGSPWIYGYVSQKSRFANSVCVGVLVLILAGAGSSALDETRI